MLDVQAMNKQHLHAFAELCRARTPVSQLLVAEALGVKVGEDARQDIFAICETLDRASRFEEA